jgi:hypothetical protein
MKEKLLALWAKVQPWLDKAWAWSPFACGLVCGYFGKPIIQLAIDVAAKLIKTFLG